MNKLKLSSNINPRKQAKIKENLVGWGFVLPYFSSFFLFITIPVLLGILLSFTYFDLINTPKFIGLNNFVNLFTADDVFMQQLFRFS
jgi:multiple sugar transport system permease protein